MKVTTKSMMLAAAFSGLLAGTMSPATAAVPQGRSNPTLSSRSSLAGQPAGPSVADSSEKHACQGKNSCKGNGGCKAGDNGCKGKNSCKGKGGCATDGSKKGQLAA